MALKPPSPLPMARPKISITVKPPQAGGAQKPNMAITVRTPVWGSAQGKRSRKKPFIDIKGAVKTALKQSTAVGQVKALIQQFKNIHSLGDAFSAAKNAYNLAKKFGLIGGTNKLLGKGSFTGRFSGKLFAQGSNVKRGLSTTNSPPVLPKVDVTERVNKDIFSPDNSGFISKIISSGLARANRFRVIFTAPEGMPGLKEYIGGVTLMCEQAEFPGRAFNATDSRIYGPTFKTPHESQYTEVNFTVLCTQGLLEKVVFDSWMDYINPIVGVSGKNGSGFDLEYRANYISSVKIIQYNDLGDETYAVELKEAFPTAVSPISASWQDDQFHKFQVTMCYRWWEIVKPAKSAATSVRQPNPSESSADGAIHPDGISVRDISVPKISKFIPTAASKAGESVSAAKGFVDKVSDSVSKLPTPVKSFGKSFLGNL